MKFRLLRGRHSVGSGLKLAIFKQGDVIETDQDLVKRLNRPHSVKVELVPDDTPATPIESRYRSRGTGREEGQGIPTPFAPIPTVDDSFDELTVAQLQQFAASEGIDLGTATKKADIISKLRQAASA